MRDTGHFFMGKGCPDDVGGQVLRGLLVSGLNPRAAIHVEAGVLPRGNKSDNLLQDLPFPQERFEDLMLRFPGPRTGMS
jgi:hypothetical protein